MSDKLPRSVRAVLALLATLTTAGTPLRAQPPTLAFSSFLGGSDIDGAQVVAADADGFVYLAGVTLSDDFPDPHPLPPGPRHEVFVVKLDPAGGLVWATRFGGSHNEIPYGIALAPDRVWVTGWTHSPDFPRIGPPPFPGQPPTVSAVADVFLTSLDLADGTLLSSSNLGGPGDDYGEGVAVDARGDVYVTGGSMPGFPLVGGLPPAGTGHFQVFVVKLSADGAHVVYSTRFGGSEAASGQDIAVDADGNALVVGLTNSRDFPAVRAAQGTYGGGFLDAFVTKLAPSGEAISWSTFLGGTGVDHLYGIALDRAGRAWVAGVTGSPNFPVRAPLQPHLGGGLDAMIAGFSPGGERIASTWLGGGQEDGARGIAVDAAGGLRIAGWTRSADFPVVHPVQAACGMPEPYCYDAFVAELRPAAAGVVWATYLGGRNISGADGVAVDPEGSTWAVGGTQAINFPQVRPLQPFGFGITDAWVAKIEAANRPPDCTAATATPGRLWPPNGKLQPIAIGGVTDSEGDPILLRVTAIRQDEPLSKKGQPDASGIGTARPLLRADRAGGGDGRVYHLRFAAEDGQGGRCEGEVTVCVPHDPGRASCGDGGAFVDSTDRKR